MSEDEYAYGEPNGLTLHLEVALKLQRELNKQGIPATPREIRINHNHIEAFESLRQLIQDDLHAPFVKAFCRRFPVREYDTIPDAELLQFAIQLEERKLYRF